MKKPQKKSTFRPSYIGGSLKSSTTQLDILMQYFVTVNPGIRECTGQGGGRECSGGGGRGARGRGLGALGARGWRQGAAPGAQAWGGGGLVDGYRPSVRLSSYSAFF